MWICVYDLNAAALNDGASCASALQETARTRACRWAQPFTGWFRRGTGWTGPSLPPLKCTCTVVIEWQQYGKLQRYLFNGKYKVIQKFRVISQGNICCGTVWSDVVWDWWSLLFCSTFVTRETFLPLQVQHNAVLLEPRPFKKASVQETGGKDRDAAVRKYQECEWVINMTTIARKVMKMKIGVWVNKRPFYSTSVYCNGAEKAL